tara:strand:+ start:9262 stop:10482 length:1221 start_codon:yes stop_codon:yes gene_type:complete
MDTQVLVKGRPSKKDTRKYTKENPNEILAQLTGGIFLNILPENPVYSILQKFLEDYKMECDKAPANRRIIKTAKCKMGNSVIFDRFIKNFLADSDSTLSLIDVVKIKQTIDALEKNQYRILRNLQGIDLPNYYTMFIGYQLNNVKSLIDIILLYANKESIQINIPVLIENIMSTFSGNPIINLEKLPYTYDTKKDYSIIVKECDDLLQFITNYLYTTYELNIVFISRNHVENNKYIFPKEVYDSKLPNHVYLIDYHINYFRSNKLVILEPIYCLDIQDKKHNSYKLTDIKLDYFYRTIIGQPLKKPKKQVVQKSEKTDVKTTKKESYIQFNPYDKGELLNIIEVPISESVTKRFLIGKAVPNSTTNKYNLYEDDDSNNNLVGRLSFEDQSENIANISWCVDYRLEE